MAKIYFVNDLQRTIWVVGGRILCPFCWLAYSAFQLFCSWPVSSLSFYLYSQLFSSTFTRKLNPNFIQKFWLFQFSAKCVFLYSFPSHSISIVNHKSKDPEYEHLATYSTFLVKFWTAITFFAINLQSMETYPT